ncbi:UNVERIFIED_CONTAM: hypothetical protein FKN15_064479 [Acipenser sinensis]
MSNKCPNAQHHKPAEVPQCPAPQTSRGAPVPSTTNQQECPNAQHHKPAGVSQRPAQQTSRSAPTPSTTNQQGCPNAQHHKPAGVPQRPQTSRGAPTPSTTNQQGVARAAAVLLSDPCFQLHSIQHLLGESELLSSFRAAPPSAERKHFSLHTFSFSLTLKFA